MDLQVTYGNPLEQKTPCLILLLPEGKLSPLAKEVDKSLEGLLSEALRNGEYAGKKQQTLLLHTGGKLPCERILVLGLGKGKVSDGEILRLAAAAAAKYLAEKNITGYTLVLPEDVPTGLTIQDKARITVEGLMLASYRFDRYRSKTNGETPKTLQSLTLLVPMESQLADAEAGALEGRQLCRGVNLARDLVNEPGNVKSPEYLAQQARDLAAEHGFECTILGKKELEQEGMGALLGVAQGSVREPRLIVLQYRGGAEDLQPIALIGKGVVFDSGGISLKPGEKMDQMKMDMAGGATVLGTFLSTALLKIPVNLIGVIPAVENMPSGNAIRPGDILTSLSGQTIEVLNTDAEGRMILADALTYVERFDPRAVIDLATLTGACIIALGHHATAVLGNHAGLIRQLLKSGEETGERLWQLPLWQDYTELIKSDIADMKNTGGRAAGTITAAAFLQKFAKKYRWAHLDIAGTAWEENGAGYRPKGATGVGVRLMVHYLRQCMPPQPPGS